MYQYNILKIIRLLITPGRFYLKSKLSNGAVVYGRNKHGYGGRGVYLQKDSIEPELYYLDKLLDNSGVFIDIGANTGVYTLKSAKHYNNNGIVVALEPFPEIFHDLCVSVSKNNFRNVRLRNFGAAEFTGTQNLWLNNNVPNTFSIKIRVPNSKGLSIFVVSIDDLVTWEKLERVDYIKIDAEGSEEEIIKGAKKTIDKYRPIIQAETFDKVISVSLSNYSVYRAPGSINILYVPNENSKKHIIEELKWQKIQ